MSDKKYLSIDSSIMYRCNQKYFDRLLSKYDIGYTQLIFLTQIYEDEGVSMNELATSGVFDKGTITKSIQKLEQLGYVRIESSEIDKRSKLLYTTDKSQEIMPELYRMRSEWNTYLCTDVSDEEMDAYYAVLSKIIDKARAYSKIELEQEFDEVKFYGLQKLTLLDYPGKMAATVFTGGCNFRCPFCHNRSLVFLNENESEISEYDIIEYLRKRKGVLDGICITGGEPLLQKGIKRFIKVVREIGMQVKLDTNGSQFEILKDLIDEGLVDYVAMDIKNSKEKYSLTTAQDNLDLSSIEKSIAYLLEGHVDYEFRTTVVSKFHEVSDIKAIGEWIKGAKAYYLQNFEDHGTCILEGLEALPKETLFEMKDIALEYVKHCEVRGVKD